MMPLRFNEDTNMPEDLFSRRKPLTEILDVPPTVTSVYSMVQHILGR